MYSNVVLGVESYNFEELIENYKLTKGVLLDTELDENDWNGLIKDFKNVVKEKTLAVIMPDSKISPESETSDAIKIVDELGLDYKLLDINSLITMDP